MHDAAVAVAGTLDNEHAKGLELCPGGDEVFLRQGIGWRSATDRRTSRRQNLGRFGTR